MDTFKSELPDSQLRIWPRPILKLTDFTNGSRHWHAVEYGVKRILIFYDL